MLNLFEKNGLVFWNEKQIRLRRMMESYFVDVVRDCLRSQNKAFDLYQVEAPILTPKSVISPQYTENDVFHLKTDLCLRPETTAGSYLYAYHLLMPNSGVRMPLCVWQHGKSFRNEQDQATKHMRLKEFYQLEFQILYSESTKCDYSVELFPAICKAMSNMIGPCRLEDSDRIPSYSERTVDVVHEARNMEVCSMSKRKDWAQGKCVEVAIGTDRCVFCFENREPDNVASADNPPSV